jgi:aromatic-L-amino-acid/L-tryptophan decarboxylase
VNRSGRAYLTSTRLDAQVVGRVCVGQTTTTREHVEALWALIHQVAGG